MKLSPTRQLRVQLQRLNHIVHGRLWFPHMPLAALLALGSLWLLQRDLGAGWKTFWAQLLAGHPQVLPQLLPQLLIGTGMLIMALGLLLRSRVAWVMALLLATTAAVSLMFGRGSDDGLLIGYFILVVAVLLAAWREFDRSSVTASTLFALTSVAMLLLYSTFGAYYLGGGFRPKIGDLPTALYYAVVTMSTVGYGDIIRPSKPSFSASR